MKRVYRRVLFFISTIVFLAIAPLIIFYSIGYQFSAHTVDPVPVGVVSVETMPRRADVYVNSRLIGKTPRAVPNLLAGTADVSVKKDGYIPWEKRVPVEPGLVTDVTKVRLFPAKPARTTIVPEVNLFVLSPNRQLLAVVSDTQTLTIVDEAGQPVVPTWQLTQPVQQLVWSPNNASILLKYRTGTWAVIDATGASQVIKPLPLLRSAKQVVWDPRVTDRLLIQTAGNILQAYNVTSGSSSVLARDVVTFAPSARMIYVAHSTGTITEHTLQGTQTAALPIKTDKPVQQLFVTPGGQIALQQADGSVGLIKDRELVTIASSAVTVSWSPNELLLLVQTEPAALYVYNVGDERSTLPLNQLQLITRLSRPMNQVAWFAGGEHVVYQVDDEIVISEIDVRDHPITYSVDTTNLGNAQTAVGTDGDVIYYLKQTDGKISLLRTSLTIPE